MNQVHITEYTPLLDQNGLLVKPGYATHMLYDYNRSCVRGHPFRLKEWDFYQAGLGRWVLQMVIGHVSYMANFSATLLSLDTGERYQANYMSPLPLRRIPMSPPPDSPHRLCVRGRRFCMTFQTGRTSRVLLLQSGERDNRVEIRLVLPHIQGDEAMVIATPFDKPGQFYLNCKKHFYGVRGYARFGNVTVTASGKETALLDWGRGVWPFHQEWFWGCGAGEQAGGRFGFNIGWGFGDLTHATENIFFWNGKAYKIGNLIVQRDRNNLLAPWRFVSEEGNLDLTMQPVYDNDTCTRLAFVDNRCHQVFGCFSGIATLPDGRIIPVKDLLAFCEHAVNNW